MPARERWESPSLAGRLKYAAAVSAIQNLVLWPMSLAQSASSYFSPSDSDPALVKRYPCRPHLSVGIFYPPSHDPASPKPLPTLFTIHGGGFFAGSPTEINHLNARYASRGLLVVTLTYGLAPSGAFPGPVHDVAALVGAVIDDPSLPVDKARVALLGWSAGGNLALTAAQLPALRGRVAATVPVYPSTDWTPDLDDKMATRRQKPSLGGFRGRPGDVLTMVAPLAEWAYLPVGQDLRDPLLSPRFSSREDLPPRVFIVAAELDILAGEAWRTAWALSGREGGPGDGDAVGREEEAPPRELILDDERYHWEENGVRWLLVPDATHGFDMDLSKLIKDKEAIEDGRVKAEKVVDLTAEWLFEVMK